MIIDQWDGLVTCHFTVLYNLTFKMEPLQTCLEVTAAVVVEEKWPVFFQNLKAVYIRQLVSENSNVCTLYGVRKDH